MNKLRLPGFHEIPRLIGRDADETEAKLYEYFENPYSAFFNYRFSRTFARYAYGRMLPLQRILDGCGREKTAQGRICNEEVIKHLWNLSNGRLIQTYQLAPRSLHIRKDLSIRVALPFYFVENGIPSAFWLQPRKFYALNIAELGFLASMVKLAVLVDDFSQLDFEICDMSASAFGKDREPTIYRLDSFRIDSEDETRDKLQILAIAYDRLVARGVQRSQRTPKPPESNQPDFFAG